MSLEHSLRKEIEAKVHNDPAMFGGGLQLLVVDHKNYQLVKPFVKHFRICDRDIISEGFEKMSYSVLADEDFIGFFLIHPATHECAVSVIIDLNASSSGTKLEAAGYHGLSLVDFTEITLICSNASARVKGAATALVKLIITTLCTHQKNVILWVANPTKNARSFQFYEGLGFKRLGTLPGMVYGPCKAQIEEISATASDSRGGSPSPGYITYHGRKHRIHIGSRGGRYIVSNTKRVYV